MVEGEVNRQTVGSPSCMPSFERVGENRVRQSQDRQLRLLRCVERGQCGTVDATRDLTCIWSAAVILGTP